MYERRPKRGIYICVCVCVCVCLCLLASFFSDVEASSPVHHLYLSAYSPPTAFPVIFMRTCNFSQHFRYTNSCLGADLGRPQGETQLLSLLSSLCSLLSYSQIDKTCIILITTIPARLLLFGRNILRKL